ncbi:MAG: DoxX family membrane protein [Actinomycetota bacterium]
MDFDTVMMLGRIVFSALFIGSGIGHFADTEGSTAYAQTKGLGENSQLLVQISGACLALGGVAMLLGALTDLAALLLAVLMLVLAFVMHAFWKETDDQAKQLEMSMFMKNLAIAGGALVISGAYGGPGGEFLTGQLIDPVGLW